MTRYGDTINEWAVRILLECILVNKYYLLDYVQISRSAVRERTNLCSTGFQSS